MKPTSPNCNFYTQFKPIRNTLRRYSPQSVLQGCLQHLYSPAPDRLSQLKKMPWIHLLLVKWAFLDEQAERVGRPAISWSALHRLLQQVYELSNHTRMPNDYEHVNLFMRAIAYQQFPYQDPLNFDGLARQSLLFSQVPKNHFFRVHFQEKHGFSLDTFLQLAACLLTRFLIESSYEVPRTWFSSLERTYPPDNIDSFLASISVNIENLSATLRKTEEKNRQALEYFQQTPFINYPLIRVGQIYWCIYPEILQRRLDHYLFDFFKKSDPQRFNEAFGSKRFEDYVGIFLKDGGLPFATESELNRVLSGAGKVVDFLVVNGNANIFIDAKGVEMAPRGKVAHLCEVVRGATKSSLMKAFEQGQEICSRIAKMDNTHPVIQPRQHNYLLAVTYKELYIGNGLSLSAAVGDEAIERIQKNLMTKNLIPLENIYFLTIDEFEVLIALHKAGRISLVDALERAKRADSNPATRKFMFKMHLMDWPERYGLQPPLSETMKALFEVVRKALGSVNVLE